MHTINKDVLIRIQGTQCSEGKDEQSLELITDGKLSGSSRGWSITYPESELTGMDGTITTFEVLPDTVTLRRRGTVAADVCFQEGSKSESLYRFGNRTVLVGIRARRVKTDLTENGGHVEVDYDVEIEHSRAGVSRYDLNIRPVEPAAEAPAPEQ